MATSEITRSVGAPPLEGSVVTPVSKTSWWGGRNISPTPVADSAGTLFSKKVTPLESSSYNSGMRLLITEGSNELRMLQDAATTTLIDAHDISVITGNEFNANDGVFGVTTALHLVWGLNNAGNSVLGLKRAVEIGDNEQVLLSAGNVVQSIAQAGTGASYAVVRGSAIGQIVNPSNSTLGSINKTSSSLGGGFAAALYGFLTFANIRKYWKNMQFYNKLAEKDPNEQIAYIKKRVLGEREESLWNKAESKFKGNDKKLIKIALKELRPGVKQNIKLLEKLDNKKYGISDARIDAHIKHQLGNNALIQKGREIVVERLKAKKIAKMTRMIGEKGVEAVLKNAEMTKQIAAGTLDGSRLSATGKIEKLLGAKQSHFERIIKDEAQETLDNAMGTIVLEELELKTDEYRQNLGIYLAGTACMVLMSVGTGGLAPLALLAWYALVAGGEARIAVNEMHDIRNAPVAPGKFDWVGPALGVGLATTALVGSTALISVFSFGIAPLVVALCIGVSWIAISIYEMHLIKKQRERFIEGLMAKETINLAEFEYLVKYMPKTDHEALRDKKLSEKDKNQVALSVIPKDGRGIDYLATVERLKEATERQRLNSIRDAIAKLLSSKQ